MMKRNLIAEFISTRHRYDQIKVSLTFLLGSMVSLPLAMAEEMTIARNIQFNPNFLYTDSPNAIDLNLFANGNTVLPGDYRADIYLNGTLIINDVVTFHQQNDGNVAACVSQKLFEQLNVDTTHIPAARLQALADKKQCIGLNQLLPSAQSDFDTNEQRLNISIPQVELNRSAQGSVSPLLWDSGSTAAFLGYSVNTYSSQSNGTDYKSVFASLNTGLNLGEWYFRHNGSYGSQTGSGSKYQSINSYVQHDISAIRGRALIGEANTSGRMFDTVGYKGVSVFSDEQMLPLSQRGYAPEIRGVANSNAKVTVLQGDNVIYETSMPPGEFVINDIYPTGFGGDLRVNVREADGTVRTFLVPYASVTDLLRPGAQRYEVVAGKYRNQALSSEPVFYQATYQRGINNVVSLYGGSQISSGYSAFQGGGALGTSVGAMAFDITQANTHFDDAPSMSGQSYRLSYSKLVSETKSNFSIAAYRFSTQGYLDFATAMQYQDTVKRGFPIDTIYRTKNRFTLTLTQGFPGSYGQLYLTGILQNYWDNKGRDRQYQVGYSNRWQSVSHSLSLNRSRVLNGRMENTWMLMLSVPLTRPSVSLNANAMLDADGRLSEQIGVSGSAGDSQEFSWGVSAARDAEHNTSGSVNGQYRTPYTSMSGGASIGRNNSSLSAGLSGNIVAHPRGVTLSPYNSDTFIVVSAPGAAGASVATYPGLKLDHWGNAVVPSLAPYQRNEIAIDPKNLPNTVELGSTSQYAIPRAGAVVMVDFDTKQGYGLLLSAADTSTVHLPFGSNVTDDKGNQVGVVSQGEQLYARVEQARGKLFATWNNNGVEKTCVISYDITSQVESENIPAIIEQSYVCRG